MFVTWQTIITVAAVLAAVFAIVRYYNKVYDWIQTQSKQEKEIKSLKEEQQQEIKTLKEEQQLLTYGVLACLKGLREQGCDGAVTDAINKMEKYLNEKAHA